MGEMLGWPLIGDVLSQTGQPLPCADLWLGNGKAVSELEQAQIVVQLGSSLTGKRLLQWQATCEPEEYWLVDNLPGRLDPAQHRGRRLVCPVGSGLSCIRRKNVSPGRRRCRFLPSRPGRRRSNAARALARPSSPTAFIAICRIRDSCSSAIAWWCA